MKNIFEEHDDLQSMIGVPKRDGSGKGIRENFNRGGCDEEEYFNASAGDIRKEVKKWYDKAHRKLNDANGEMRMANEAYAFVKTIKKEDKVLPKRVFKKADDWLKKVIEDKRLIDTKIRNVNAQWDRAQKEKKKKNKLRNYRNLAKNGYQYIDRHKDQMKKKRKRLEGEVSVFKKVTLAAIRGAFLTVLALNFRGFASRVENARLKDKRNYNRILNLFKRFGGKESKFIKNLNKGKKKKPLLGKKKSFDGYNFSNSTEKYFSITAETVAAIAGAASAILVPLAAILKNVKGDKEPDDTDNDTGDDYDDDTGDDTGKRPIRDKKIPTWTYFAGGGAVLGTILLIFRKKFFG